MTKKHAHVGDDLAAVEKERDRKKNMRRASDPPNWNRDYYRDEILDIETDVKSHTMTVARFCRRAKF